MGSAIGATTGFVTDFLTDSDYGDVFPNEDFFPDISTLFLDDMANDGSNAGGSTSATAVYIFCLNLVLIISKVLCLAVFLVICLNMYSLFHMISILPIILIMFYLAFIMDNSLGKLLYFSTIQKPYFRQFAPSGFVASMKPPVFEGVNYKRWVREQCSGFRP